MTRKEAIKWLIYPTITTTGEAKGIQKKQLDAYYMAIDALSKDLLTHEEAWEQIETPTDLINRFDIDCLLIVAQDEGDITLDECNKFYDLLDRVSFVSAESKRGKWIRQTNGDGWNEWYVNICDQCGFQVGNKHDDRAYRYCPNCGARMASK